MQTEQLPTRPETTSTPFTAPERTLARKPLLSSDDFPGVVLQLDERHRLIASGVDGSHGSCWAIQYRDGPDRWTGRKYLTRARYVPHAVQQLKLGRAALETATAWAATPGLAGV
ncbi:hypothetical protein C6Y62_04730 [Hyphomicrobium sulfonivorans]|nr:hypothetical protein [Hyphomicrobium sulfonivorans]